MIEIDGINKEFDSGRRRDTPVVALKDVNLRMDEGEFLTIVGRSGCGKSTLLRLIAGLLEPTEGSITIDGDRVTGPRRDIGMVFQRPALFPWRHVVDNILLPIQMLHLPVDEYRDRAYELLEMAGIADFAHNYPHELSGGMQQRAALCRSLVYDPRVLLMDEPFGALDALTREELGLELQRIWSEYKKTIIFVTHSISEAVLLADRVIVLTSRPGQVARDIAIDFPRPRSLGRQASSEADVELKHYGDEIRDLLFEAPGSPRAAVANE